MFFFTLSNTDIQFLKKELTQRFYTIVKALLPIKQVEIIDKKKFAKAALNKNVKAFVVHMTFINLNKQKMSIQLAKEALIALLIVEKVQILTEYSDFSNRFLEEKAFILPK